MYSRIALSCSLSLSLCPTCRGSTFQVTASDRLSGRICHGCISYLNSWTSFKGRCVAAQRQQKIWLANGGQNGAHQQSMDVDDQEAYNYYPQYHKKVS